MSISLSGSCLKSVCAYLYPVANILMPSGYPTGKPDGNQRWLESLFQTATPLLFQIFESGCGPCLKSFQLWESGSCSDQGCGAGTQISGSGSRHLKFLTPVRFGPQTKNHCFICTTRLPNKLCLLNGNPNSGYGVKRRFWHIIVCQLLCLSEHRNKVWRLRFDVCCVN